MSDTCSVTCEPSVAGASLLSPSRVSRRWDLICHPNIAQHGDVSAGFVKVSDRKRRAMVPRARYVKSIGKAYTLFIY